MARAMALFSPQRNSSVVADAAAGTMAVDPPA